MSKRNGEQPRAADTKRRFSDEALDPIVAEATKDNAKELEQAFLAARQEKLGNARTDLAVVLDTWSKKWSAKVEPVITFSQRGIIRQLDVELM